MNDAADGPAPADIQTLDSREVYANRWLRLREDRVRFRNGLNGAYSVVEKPDCAAIAPLDGDRLHLVEQYRYPIGARVWELPQGAPPDRTAPIAADALARAELREETGLIAGRIEPIGRLRYASSFCDQDCFIFLATDLTEGPPAREAEEQDMIARAFPVAEVKRMILCGEIVDAMTVAVIGLLSLQGRL
ncbi:MAG: NUDIX hydrolase [Pseudomonadota bacterium]